eukprot:6188937-Pleurochrysis_carterae.AAC.1
MNPSRAVTVTVSMASFAIHGCDQLARKRVGSPTPCAAGTCTGCGQHAGDDAAGGGGGNACRCACGPCERLGGSRPRRASGRVRRASRVRCRAHPCVQGAVAARMAAAALRVRCLPRRRWHDGGGDALRSARRRDARALPGRPVFLGPSPRAAWRRRHAAQAPRTGDGSDALCRNPTLHTVSADEGSRQGARRQAAGRGRRVGRRSSSADSIGFSLSIAKSSDRCVANHAQKNARHLLKWRFFDAR